MSLIHHLRHKRQVVTSEGIRVSPFFTLFVETTDRDIVSDTDRSFVLPDRGFDGSQTDFVDGLLFLLGHREVRFGE